MYQKDERFLKFKKDLYNYFNNMDEDRIDEYYGDLVEYHNKVFEFIYVKENDDSIFWDNSGRFKYNKIQQILRIIFKTGFNVIYYNCIINKYEKNEIKSLDCILTEYLKSLTDNEFNEIVENIELIYSVHFAKELSNDKMNRGAIKNLIKRYLFFDYKEEPIS